MCEWKIHIDQIELCRMNIITHFRKINLTDGLLNELFIILREKTVDISVFDSSKSCQKV